MEDVVIEELNPTGATVIATMSVARGEQMLLHVEDAPGNGTTYVVEGIERRPVVRDGQMRHRLRLRIVQTEREESA